MSFISRAMKSVLRKPLKSILLFLVIMIMSISMITSYTLKGANVVIQDDAKKSLGASLTLEMNIDNYRQRMVDIADELGENEGSKDGYWQKKTENGSWASGTSNAFASLHKDDIDKLAKVQGVERYNIVTNDTAVNPVNFKRIEDSERDQSYDVGGVHLIGNLVMDMNPYVNQGYIELLEGRYINQDDRDACVISKELADLNHLSLGDSLKFNDCKDKETSTVYKAEIVGIYKINQPMPSTISGDTYCSENAIFTDLRFPEKPEGSKGEPLYMKAIFEISSTKDYDEVKKNMKETHIEWSRYDLIDNQGKLESVGSNFDQLESYSDMILKIIFIMGTLLLMLVFFFWIHNRSKEFAILISLGVEKYNIFKQLILEALIIGCLAFMIGVVLSYPLTQNISEYMLKQQQLSIEEKNVLDQGKVSSDEDSHQVQKIEKIQFKMTSTILTKTLIQIIVLETITICIVSIKILKKKPSEILSEMNC